MCVHIYLLGMVVTVFWSRRMVVVCPLGISRNDTEIQLKIVYTVWLPFYSLIKRDNLIQSVIHVYSHSYQTLNFWNRQHLLNNGSDDYTSMQTSQRLTICRIKQPNRYDDLYIQLMKCQWGLSTSYQCFQMIALWFISVVLKVAFGMRFYHLIILNVESGLYNRIRKLSPTPYHL